MGFFSWSCPHCKKSILSKEAVGKRDDGAISPDWAEVTFVSEDMIASGIYDGYGRLTTKSETVVNLPEDTKLYHKRCYELAGRPTFTSAEKSGHAKDQGYFVKAEDYAGVPGN